MIQRDDLIRETLRKESHINLMFILRDAYIPTNKKVQVKASTGVIVIAVVVGSLISAVCLIAVICMIVKGIKKKGDEDDLQDEDDSSDRQKKLLLQEKVRREQNMIE